MTKEDQELIDILVSRKKDAEGQLDSKALYIKKITSIIEGVRTGTYRMSGDLIHDLKSVGFHDLARAVERAF